MAEESKLIENWIRGQVAKVYKKTGKAICPFAKKTLQDKTIQITKAKVDLLEHIIHCCHMVPIFRLDIVVLYIDYKISEQRLATICKQAHNNKLHMAIMYDHPDNKGLHKGVSFSLIGHTMRDIGGLQGEDLVVVGLLVNLNANMSRR